MELRAYLEIIRKRLWVILGVMLCIIGVYSVFFFTQSPSYTAETRVMLRLPPEWEDMPAVNMPGWTTRISLAASKPVLERSARKLQEQGMNITPEELNAGISVNGVDETDFVDLRFTASRPERAIKIVNTHADVFLAYDNENNRENMEGAKETLENELERANNRLEKTENKLNRAKRMEQQIQKLNEVQERFNKLQSKFGPKHPRLIQARNRKQQQEEEIKQLRASMYPNQEFTMGLNEWLSEQPAPERIRRQIVSNQQRVRELQSDLDLIRFNLALLDRSGSLVSNAQSTTKHYPATAETYAFVVLVALILGVSTGSLLEYLNDRIENQYDVNLYLDLPVLGVIPEVEPDELNLMNNPMKTPLSERYHEISSLIQFAMVRDQARQVLQVTSTQAEEGKSITALNLSVTLAREGEQVLLIDMDLRDPQQHHLFSLMNSQGVSEIIGGDVELDNLLAKKQAEQTNGDIELLNRDTLDSRIEFTEDQLPDVLSSGYLPMNPIQDLKSDFTDELIRVASENYSTVIIDSPPIGSVIDPVILSTKVDGVLFVVGSGEVRKADAHHSKRLLQEVDAPILGVILNKVRYDVRDYYYPYGYGPENN